MKIYLLKFSTLPDLKALAVMPLNSNAVKVTFKKRREIKLNKNYDVQE